MARDMVTELVFSGRFRPFIYSPEQQSEVA